MKKSSEILMLLLNNGWEVVRQSGSHVILRHETKGQMSFPNHGSKDMATGTLKKILKQAGLKIK